MTRTKKNKRRGMKLQRERSSRHYEKDVELKLAMAVIEDGANVRLTDRMSNRLGRYRVVLDGGVYEVVFDRERKAIRGCRGPM